MGRARKHRKVLFCWPLNIVMMKIKFSGLFPPKHKSPIGNDSGYYLTPAQALAQKIQQEKKKNKSR
jgi:hypothetical protein